MAGYNKASHAKWYAKPENRVKRAAYQKKYQSLHGSKRYNKPQYRLKRYGLTQEQYDEMFCIQAARCGACEEHIAYIKSERLCIDHCHSTGKVRGLLCTRCNLVLGLVKDDSDVLVRLINYLIQALPDLHEPNLLKLWNTYQQAIR